MGLVKDIVAVVAGVCGLLGTMYALYEWTRRRIEARQRTPDSKTAQLYVQPQRSALETWRLFDFRRDIKMMDVYVEEILELPGSSPIGSKVHSASKPEETVFRELDGDIREGGHIYTIEGQAGSGKSTMLRNWTLKLLSAHENSTPSSGRPIPIYVSLQHIIPSDTDSTDITIADMSKAFLRTIPILTDEAATRPFARFESLRKEAWTPQRRSFVLRGFESCFRLFRLRKMADRLKRATVHPPEWILLVDGLDEMRSQLRGGFLRWIKGLPLSCRVVLSTRPDVGGQVNIPNARQFAICDFDETQVETFVYRWFGQDNDLAGQLLSELNRNSSLSKLASIPLLLTCLAIDVEVRGEATFPQQLRETDILRRVVRLLLGQWDAMKAGTAVNSDQMRLGMKVLTELAIERPENPSFTHEELSKKVSSVANEHGLSSDEANEFLSRITTGVRLLVGQNDTEYHFGHKIFFDFFFAEGMQEVIHADE